MLGAWIGNNIDQATVWSPVLDKIRENLDRCDLKASQGYHPDDENWTKVWCKLRSLKIF
jgi:hypothetical protein